jgi:AcrR family transcriptional regulator
MAVARGARYNFAMPKISQDAYNARRARIVEAAVKSFAQHGIHVSVDEICSEAGISKGALYGYFPSKDAIIQAIAADYAADFDALRAASDPVILRNLMIQRIWDGQRAGCRLELEAWTYGLTNEGLGRQLRENLQDLRESIEAALTRMQEAGVIRLRVSAGEAAAVIETFSVGTVAQVALSDMDRAEDIAAQFGTLFGALLDAR